MNVELIMLGTGSAMVTKCYNTCFALRNDEEYFLVDAGGGNGILAQLEKAEISYKNIKGMFVTHGHTDHIMGAVWIIRKYAALMNEGKFKGEFNIYGHNEVVNILNTLSNMMLTKKLVKFISNGINICEVWNEDKIDVIGMSIEFFDIESSKDKQFGFKAILPNKKTLVCLGDEPYNEVNRKYVENCDWLLSEAFCLYADRHIFKPYEKNHSTPIEAGKLAKELNVENLVLYHTEDKKLSQRKKLYTEEAKSVYNGQVFVPGDLERIEIL
ncbi:MBL fold metallo-hydrolase [Clostridium celatum]|uniref:MBL fold metallo-hydrolase n=1 Tax=Clostridium celatum TaxID=36834 RepID=UPI0029159C90|nr:MBL fold metallo-hydrolase [Clostridium celatum]